MNVASERKATQTKHICKFHHRDKLIYKLIYKLPFAIKLYHLQNNSLLFSTFVFFILISFTG